jgi:hypothetical protein
VSEDSAPTPSLWYLLAVIPGTVLVVGLLTTFATRVGARRPIAETLRT